MHESRQTKQHILYIFGSSEDAYSLRRSYEIDLNKIIKDSLSSLPYRVSLTYLSSSRKQQCFMRCLKEII